MYAIRSYYDWLYPPYQSREIVKALMVSGVDVTYCEIDSRYGHDAFLLDEGEMSKIITNFLGVITSYSIHYTKLYEPGGARISFPILFDSRGEIVITSYSIHYTKLYERR